MGQAALGRGVDPDIGHLVEPLLQLLIEILEIAEAAAEEEVLADIAIWPFDLALNRRDGCGALMFCRRIRAGAMVRPSGTRGTGSTRVRVGRPLDHGLRARAFIWPPLRLARVR